MTIDFEAAKAAICERDKAAALADLRTFAPGLVWTADESGGAFEGASPDGHARTRVYMMDGSWKCHLDGRQTGGVYFDHSPGAALLTGIQHAQSSHARSLDHATELSEFLAMVGQPVA